MTLIAAWRDLLGLGLNELYRAHLALPHYSVVLKRVALRYVDLRLDACSGCGCVRCDADTGASLLTRCPKCMHVSYCSETCRTQDWDTRHNIECPFLTSLLFLGDDGVFLRRVEKRVARLFPSLADHAHPHPHCLRDV